MGGAISCLALTLIKTSSTLGEYKGILIFSFLSLISYAETLYELSILSLFCLNCMNNSVCPDWLTVLSGYLPRAAVQTQAGIQVSPKKHRTGASEVHRTGASEVPQKHCELGQQQSTECSLPSWLITQCVTKTLTSQAVTCVSPGRLRGDLELISCAGC